MDRMTREAKVAEWRVIDEFYYWNSQRGKEPGYDSGLARLAEAVRELQDAREEDARKLLEARTKKVEAFPRVR